MTLFGILFSVLASLKDPKWKGRVLRCDVMVDLGLAHPKGCVKSDVVAPYLASNHRTTYSVRKTSNDQHMKLKEIK